MQRHPHSYPAALITGLALLAAACGGKVGGATPDPNRGISVLDRSINVNPDGLGGGSRADAGPGKLKPDRGPVTPGKKALGGLCSTNTQCLGSICHKGKCTRACSTQADCPGATHDCGVVSKRLICYPRTYMVGLGKACGSDGQCCCGLTCNGGGKGTAQAFCSGKCTDDTGCPPSMTCQTVASGKKECVPHEYCAGCQYDAQCPTGHKCVLQGGRKSCLKKCRAGSSECPGYTTCQAAAGGNYCVHKSGSCRGNGSQCAACSSSADCNMGGMCLTFSTTGESFCASSCSGGSCPGGYGCYSKVNKCVPTQKSTCTSSLSPMMEVGDTMEDFAMVGKADTNNDYSLSGEKLKVLRLSDFSSKKVILFIAAAGWCGPCKSETKQFKALLQSLGPKGLVVFQTLIAGVTKTSPPTAPDLQFLDAWISSLNAVGAIGIDPKMVATRYNTSGTVPLNMIIDAKTLKIREKWNGSSSLSGLKAKLGKYL